MKPDNQIKKTLNPISISLIVIAAVAGLGLLKFQLTHWSIAIALMVLLVILAAAIRIADQWEKAVVLRMGKFQGLKGPGFFMIIPIIDRVDDYIDQRVRVTDFTAEKTLTKDTVPVDVVAIVYWTVWDVEKAALEVRRYAQAVTYMALTGLRDTIGRHELADLLQHREKIAEKFSEASQRYQDNPVALQLRGMNMLFEGLKEKGSLIIVPSSALESMNMGAIGGLAALSEKSAE